MHVPAGWADVVLSVATLHWVPAEDQADVLAGVTSVLGPGGVLRIDMGGDGQIADTRVVLDEVATEHGLPVAPWFFPTPEQFTVLLQEAGLQPVQARLLRRERDVADRDALAGWLCSQVLPGYLRGVWPGSSTAVDFSADAVERCATALRRDDSRYAQRYVRLDALARRP